MLHMLMAAVGGSLPPVPSFLSAGTGAREAPVSGTLQVPYPATVAAGNFLLMHVRDADAGGASITTPSGWTLIKSQFSTDTLVQDCAYFKIATGSETGNVDVTTTGGSYSAGRIYRFATGTGVEAAASAATDASGTGMSAVNVTTLGSNRLAVQLLAAQVNTTIGNITGESGADYTEAVAEYATTSLIMSCQTASVSAATAITSGSATLGSAGTYRNRIGFAIIP